MLASYTIRKSINVPDVIGLCVNGKPKMVDCKTVSNAYLGDVIAKYEAELKQDYCIRINIIALKEDEYEISVLKGEDLCDFESTYDDYDDDESFVEDCCEEIFCKSASKDDVLNILGDACAYIENDVKDKCPKEKCEEKKKSSADNFLRRLKKIIDATLEDDE